MEPRWGTRRQGEQTMLNVAAWKTSTNRNTSPCRPCLLVSLSPCLLVFFLLALPAQAAVDWPVPRGESHEPEPYRYDPARWQTVPKPFLDDAAACTLYAGLTYLIEEDGTIETITHEIVRFNGRKGVDKLGEYRNISYAPAYQKLTLN